MTFKQKLWQTLLSFSFLFQVHCYNPPNLGLGGADTTVTIHMPFESGYRAICTQGVRGEWSHNFTSTRFSIDFDTPNDRDDIVVAPIGGRAYVHDNPHDGFGRHVNIALGDGTYITLAHLKSIVIADRTEVGVGQVIGYEGTTGNSTGDHLHIGRSLGPAASPAGQGQSLSTLAFLHSTATSQAWQQSTVSSMVCRLPNGQSYTSALPPVRNHPDGTLLKAINSADVYLVNDGRLHRFTNEDNFWSNNFNFNEVVVTTPEELQCYTRSHDMPTTRISVAWSGELWLLIGEVGTTSALRHRIPNQLWREILLSWNISLSEPSSASKPAAFLNQYRDSGFYANFRDGTLIREQSRSDVYLVSNGVGQPILNWDVLRRLGLANKSILSVPDGTLSANVVALGNCQTGHFCIDHQFVESCGTPDRLIPRLPSRRTTWGMAADPDFGIGGAPLEETAEASEPSSGCYQLEWYFDADGDGYGSGNRTVACNRPSGNHVELSNDCDDANALRNPGLNEVCNSLDSNCDGIVDGYAALGHANGHLCPQAPSGPTSSTPPSGNTTPPSTAQGPRTFEICWTRMSANPDRDLRSASNGQIWFAGLLSGGQAPGHFDQVCACGFGQSGDVLQGNVAFSSTDHRLTSFGRERVPRGWSTWWAFTLNNGQEMQVGEIFADFICDGQLSGSPLNVSLVSNGGSGRDGRWTLP